MEKEEYVVIIFERKIYDSEREFILPICASVGYIKNEGNVEYFETLDGKSYEKLSEHNKENSYTKKTMGFGNVNEKDELHAEQLNSDNLIKYGLIPELVGRISSISEIKKLTKEDLKTIILNSNLSQLKLYSEFLNSMGISLINDEKFIDAVVNEANKMNTGARSINNIVSHCFEEAMFEILSNFSDYNELILTEDTVKDNKKYVLK